MIDFSFTEKLFQLKDILVSSPFFLFSIIISIILLIGMIIGIKKNRKIPKVIFVLSWIFVFTFVIIRYHSSISYIFDRLFGRLVEEIYFPSISIYTVMLIITNIIFIFSLLKKKLNNLFRIINLIIGTEINFLFFLLLDIIVKNNIDIYADLSVYSNPNLLVLLEFSMFLFIAWILILIVLLLIKKYAVKTIWINLFKEEDYEILDLTLPQSKPGEIENVEFLEIETENDDGEIVEL